MGKDEEAGNVLQNPTRIWDRIPPESMGHDYQNPWDMMGPIGYPTWNVYSWWGTVSNSWLASNTRGCLPPTFRSSCLVRTGRFYRVLFGDWQADWNAYIHLRNIFMIISYVYIYIYVKTSTNTSKHIGVNIDIKREHRYRYDHRHTAEYKNTYR